VAAIVLISIATKYSRGVAFRSQDLPADEAGYPAETLKEIYGILFARWIVKNSVVSLQQGGCSMKKIALLTAALLALSSVAASAQYGGPYYGKGKAPPPPVVTKG
jgi:hypothetical protein